MSILTIGWVRVINMLLILIIFIVIETRLTKKYPYIEGVRLSKTEIVLWLLWLLLVFQPIILPSLGQPKPPIHFVLTGWFLSGCGIWLYKQTRQQLGSHSANPVVPETGYLKTGVYTYFRHPMYVSFFLIATGISFIGHSLLSPLLVMLTIFVFGRKIYYEEKLRVQSHKA